MNKALSGRYARYCERLSVRGAYMDINNKWRYVLGVLKYGDAGDAGAPEKVSLYLSLKKPEKESWTGNDADFSVTLTNDEVRDLILSNVVFFQCGPRANETFIALVTDERDNPFEKVSLDKDTVAVISKGELHVSEDRKKATCMQCSLEDRCRGCDQCFCSLFAGEDADTIDKIFVNKGKISEFYTNGNGNETIIYADKAGGR